MRSRNKAVDAVRAADAAWLKAFTRRDFDKSVAFCDERGSMLVPNAPIATGRKAIAKLISTGFALRDYKIAWHTKKAGVARSGEFGYTSGKYKVSYKDAAGRTIYDDGKYLMVWRKQTDGAWKILFDMNNSDLPSSARL
jgi:ketosteroid isomerase-like protein